MAIQDYMKAQKLAEKQYRLAVSRGAYPYLPVLEHILRKNRIEGSVPMGQFEIPLSLVAGTVTAERTNAFASNFMPLLDYETEFGSKWSQLCDSVQEIGVTEPIIVTEYMQRFYVQEGNKRVSVSKYHGAVAIDAVVTRIIPKEDDTPEYKIYTEFIEFHRISGIYEIQMSQPGGFQRLIRAFSAPDEETGRNAVWDDELRRHVKFLYTVFETYYLAKNGARLPITAGDAFLRFIEIYGAENLIGLSSVALRGRIDRIWTEFRVLADVNPTSRILNPTESSQKVGLIRKIRLSSAPALDIAFLYPKDPEISGWAYNHEIGRRYLEDTFGDEISTKAYIAEEAEAETVIEQAIAEGRKLIFTTSPVHHAVTMRMAVAHPEVILLNCSMNTAYKQLRTYYLRIYEAKFITGMIAGSMTQNERIGYLADYPVIGVPTSIAAFALGVKMVNPRAMVYLEWSTLENHDPAELFRSKQIEIISDRDISAPQIDDKNFGLYGFFGGVQFKMAAPVWNWGSLYEDLVQSVLIGAWKNDANENSTRALNYYWGMSSGAIDVAVSEKLPGATRRLVKLVQQQMTEGKFDPFTGLLYRQDGQCMLGEGQTLTPEEIVNLNWLPDNVIGSIPDAEQLAPQFREFARWNKLNQNLNL